MIKNKTKVTRFITKKNKVHYMNYTTSFYTIKKQNKVTRVI